MSSKLAALIVGIAFAKSTPAQDSDERSALLKLVRDASRASSQKLRTGHGSGVFTVHSKKPKDAQFEPLTDATIRTFFDRGRYRLEIDYKKEWMGATRRIIVFDGTRRDSVSTLISISTAPAQRGPT